MMEELIKELEERVGYLVKENQYLKEKMKIAIRIMHGQAEMLVQLDREHHENHTV